MRPPILFSVLLSFVLLQACASTSRPDPVPSDPYLLVLEKQDGALIEIRPSTGEILERFPTARGPHEVVASRDGRWAVVAEYGDKTPGSSLAIYDLVDRKRDRGIDLAPHQRPHGMAFLDERGTVLVTSETSQAVLEVDLETGEVVRVLPTEAQGSHMLVVSPGETRVYTANIGSGTVSAIDLASGKLIDQMPVGNKPEAIDISPDGSELWVGLNGENAVVVLDSQTLATKARIDDLPLPIRVKCTRDGLVVVSCAASGEVALIGRASRTVEARIPLETIEEGPAPPGFTPGTPVPVGIVLDPEARQAYVALAAANRIAVVDLAEGRVRQYIATGSGPDGLAWVLRAGARPGGEVAGGG
jgi:YVTN family beta-propeller protein